MESNQTFKSQPTNQHLINNYNIWISVERKFKSCIYKKCFDANIHEDILSASKILFLETNKNEHPSYSFIYKTVLRACRNLKYYIPTKKNKLSPDVDIKIDIKFESLESLNEDIGYEPSYCDDSSECLSPRLAELLEYSLKSPIFHEALELIRQGHDISEIAKQFDISASGLWQNLRREGRRIEQEINSPQMNLIPLSQVQKRDHRRANNTPTPKCTPNHQLGLF